MLRSPPSTGPRTPEGYPAAPRRATHAATRGASCYDLCMADEAGGDPRASYRRALREWQEQLDRLHAVLLDGERRRPDQLKGLLNREARAKERYERERRRLLGLGE